MVSKIFDTEAMLHMMLNKSIKTSHFLRTSVGFAACRTANFNLTAVSVSFLSDLAYDIQGCQAGRLDEEKGEDLARQASEARSEEKGEEPREEEKEASKEAPPKKYKWSEIPKELEGKEKKRVALKEDDARHSGSAVSVVAVACGILLAGRLSLETLMWMGCISISRKTALTLAALASLSYVICGPVLQKTPLTNRLGHLLVERVLNARQNWEMDTLRSFCEVSIWLLVVWSTYAWDP
eukprot:s1343_g9.t1